MGRLQGFFLGAGGSSYATGLTSVVSTFGGYSLNGTLVYPVGGASLPLLVCMHGWDGDSSSFGTTERQRFAGYGLAALFMNMRGRAGVAGDKDAGALEIQDVVDVIRHVVTAYPEVVDPDQIYIYGFSGGGGTVLNAITKFPDLFNGAVDFFGMSDYGYDGTYGWWAENASYRSSVETRVGGNPSTVPNNYRSRSSLEAITNFTGGHLWLFHDAQDGTVKVTQSNRITAAMDGAGLTNYTADITDTGDNPRWEHSGTTRPQAEPLFIPDILAGTYPAWSVPASGTLKVGGYLDTKRFRLLLGTGVEEFGQVVYNMTTRVFTITSDTGAATWSLTLKGQTPSASISATINTVGDTQTSDSSGNVTFTGSV